MARHRVLSVGQCGFDHSSISRFLQGSFGAEVVAAATASEALQSLQQGEYRLVLVNRVGDRDGAPGVALIRQLKADPALRELPVMLVSNYADAQEEAVEAGALRGFGKSDLASPETRTRLAEFLGNGEA